MREVVGHILLAGSTNDCWWRWSEGRKLLDARVARKDFRRDLFNADYSQWQIVYSFFYHASSGFSGFSNAFFSRLLTTELLVTWLVAKVRHLVEVDRQT